MKSHGKKTDVNLTVCSSRLIIETVLSDTWNSSVGRALDMRSLTYECRRVWVRASKSSSNTFFTISVFWLLLLLIFLSLRNYYMLSYFLFFYFTRTMKIITGRRRLVLTIESPTTNNENNKLAVFAGYYTRCLFPLSAFLNGVACIHPSLINLNEIKTHVFEFFLACLECDSLCYNIFSLHKNFPAVTSHFPTAN